MCLLTVNSSRDQMFWCLCSLSVFVTYVLLSCVVLFSRWRFVRSALIFRPCAFSLDFLDSALEPGSRLLRPFPWTLDGRAFGSFSWWFCFPFCRVFGFARFTSRPTNGSTCGRPGILDVPPFPIAWGSASSTEGWSPPV